MSLQVRLGNLITAIGTDVKSITGKIGDLSTLTTTAKTSLVAAINENKAAIAAASNIDDTAANTSTTKTYSASKLTSVVNTSVTNAVNGLVNGAGAALDTLSELANALGNDANFATTISTALGLRLRVDVNNQGLTGTQQTNGQTNLGVYSQTQMGDPETDLAATYTTAKS